MYINCNRLFFIFNPILFAIAMETTKKIKFLREYNNFTQEYIADLLGLSTNGYGRIERGEVDINLTKLEIIAKAFNLKSSELMGLELRDLLHKKEAAN